MTEGKSSLRKAAFRLLRELERRAAVGLGKGFGAGSITEEVGCLLSFCPPPQLAVDIGANIGNYTAELRRRNPQLEIHSFEPQVFNVSKLQERFANDRKIVIVPLGVSDSERAAILYSDQRGSGLASLVHRDLTHLNLSFDVKEEVDLIRFEDYWRSALDSRHIDLVKLDIEGHELAALRGFGEALKHISVLQFEFGGCNIDTITFFKDFWTLLSGFG
jgi:FkbM family methyltransferase